MQYSKRIRMYLLFAGLVCAFEGRIPLAFAQSNVPSSDASASDDARTLFLRGQAAYNQGDYETATRVWQDAYTKDPKPLLQYNLAQAYEKLGKLPDAVAALDKYLATATPGDSHQADARAKVGMLRERLRQTGIRIVGGPEGARIMIDGKDWGLTPRPDPISVGPGSHRIRIILKGYQDFSSMVAVNAGQQVDIPLEMQPMNGPEPVLPAVVPPLPVPAVSAPVKDTSSNVLPWILVGSGAAIFVTGIVLGISAMSKAKNSASSEGSKASAARTLGLISDVAWIGGLAIAGTGGALLIWGGGGKEDSSQSNFSPESLPPSSSAKRVIQRAAVAATKAHHSQLLLTPVVSPMCVGAIAQLRF